MQKSSPKSSTTDQSWNTYWKGASHTDALSSDGVNHPAIPAFWKYFFEPHATTKGLSIADIACGNGSVIESALRTCDKANIHLTALDISEAAIQNITGKYPFVNGVVANAKNIPLDSKSYDIVCSQFGIEYAGKPAILEAARLVKKDGILGLLLHIENGHIENECKSNKNAINRLIQSNFIPLSLQMFVDAFAAIKGNERAAYEKSAKELSPAIEDLEQIMKEYGQDIAGGTVVRLYNDVDNIHRNMSRYSSSDIFSWLDSMKLELQAYSERMESMVNSSLSADEFETLKNSLTDKGFAINTADKFFARNSKQPLAWVLVATL